MATPEYGPRIRAARGYAGFSQGELAGALGVEVQWVKRRESGAQPPMPGDLLRIATATKVPLEFLEGGWDVVQVNDASLTERMAALEGRVDTLYEIALNRIGSDLGSTRRAPAEGSEVEGNQDRQD